MDAKRGEVYFDEGSSNEAISTMEPFSMICRSSMRGFTSATQTWAQVSSSLRYLLSSLITSWLNYRSDHQLLRTSAVHVEVIRLCDFSCFTCRIKTFNVTDNNWFTRWRDEVHPLTNSPFSITTFIPSPALFRAVPRTLRKVWFSVKCQILSTRQEWAKKPNDCWRRRGRRSKRRWNKFGT